MPQPAELMHAASLVSLAVLCALGLRKLVIMESLHGLRVFVLTVLLCAAALYLFSLAWPRPYGYDCEPLCHEAACFTISEM